MAIIGIDLGTTNSLVSVWKGGRVQLIPNVFGEYLTPSVVSFGEDDEVFVGKIAKEMLVTHPYSTFCEFKRNMGTNYRYHSGKKSYRAEELSAFVLRRLREDAEKFLGEPVTEASISVPAYFDDNKRCATKNAGRLAGLNVARLVNEPSAVALKHHTQSQEPEKFMVFDFGGGTLDVSLVEAFENVVEIQAVAGDNYLGGKDFNEIIADNFYEENNIIKSTLTKEEQEIILKEAEKLKIALSESNEAEGNVRINDCEYKMYMTNQKLIHISSELFSRMLQPIKKVINAAELDLDELDKVILVGGSSKMPVVRKYIQSIFEDKAEVVLEQNPDESVALGVGMAAAIKERAGEIKDMVLTDICPFSLGTATYDGLFSPIIERNETLPCRRTRTYVTVQNNQTQMTFPIYQGDNLVADDNLKLGELTVTKIPRAAKGEQGVDVTFLYDINGILDIKLESSNQTLHKVIVNKNIGMSEKEVEKRLEELRKMTIHPIEKEENRLLIEKAERLYREVNHEKQRLITAFLNNFKETLMHGKDKAIREEYVRFAVVLEEIDRGQFDFDSFDENFWSEEDSDE